MTPHVDAAARFVHDTACPDQTRPFPCPACPHPAHIARALAVLNARPRAAAAARLALHDVMCTGGVDCSDRAEHARRTQARKVAALRKFRTVHA